MQMSEVEIREAYSRMPNKNKGIGILADRNECKPRHIRAILGIPNPNHNAIRTDATGGYPSGWGKYSKPFWRFYNSDSDKLRLEFDSREEAYACAKAVYRCMSQKCIYDVVVKQRRNVLYLEKRGDKKK